MGSKGIKKTAFEINISPAGLIGAATGAYVAKKNIENNNVKELKDLMSKQPKQVGYYQQVGNLASNTHIVFTPLGVLYVLKDGNTELTVDQISVSDMNPQVMERFRAQDRAFFMNVMLNKVKSDIMMAEQSFAARMIDRKMMAGFDKGASSVSEHLDEIGYLIEKIAGSETLDFILDDEDLVISAAFSDEIDINKVANTFGAPLEFPTLKDQEKVTKSLQGKLDDPKHLAKKSVVQFLPDRVLFIVDHLVVGQLSVLDMNEEGFAAFQANNQKYFYDFFAKALGVKQDDEGAFGLFKQASEISSLKEVFFKPMVHPEFYFLLLNERMGAKWIDYDPEVLIKEIEEVFELEDQPINNIVLDKLFVLQAVNAPNSLMFKNIGAFEKAVRAMNDKPIDFLEQETNISLGEFLFAFRVFENVTPLDMIYDNFSPGVIKYIADVLASENYRLIYPVTQTPEEKDFFDALDLSVRSLIVEFIYQGESKERIAHEHSDEALIAAQSRMIVNDIRSSGKMPPNLKEFVKSYWDKLGPLAKLVGEDLEVLSMIAINSVSNNLAVDAFMEFRDKQLKELRTKFLV